MDTHVTRSFGTATLRRERARRLRRAGSALLIALVLVMLLTGYSGSLVSLALANSRSVDAAVELTRATYVAEAGINAAIAELNAGVDADGDGLGTISRNYPNPQIASSRYRVRCTTNADGSRRLVASGAVPNGLRAIEAVAAPEVPFPGGDAALGLFGPSGTHTKFKIFSDHDEEDDDDDDREVADTIKINGYPADGGAAVPALAIQDPVAYQKVMEKLSKEIAKGKVSAGSFDGAPYVAYTNKKGDTVSLPIVPLPNPNYNPTLLASLRDAIIDRTFNDIIPHADQTIATDGHKISTAVVWGTPLSPKTTVISSKDAKVKSGGVITGSGTLVIHGELKLEKGSVLNWTGNVIVIGNEDKGKDSAKLKSEGGTINVVGNVFVMGTDKGSGEFKVDNDEKKKQGSAHITGAVLVMAGPEEKKKAKLKAESGDFTVDGFIGVFGERAELKVEEEHHDTSAFTTNGAVVVAVPENDDDKHEKLSVKLHGNTSIRYDRTKLAAAMAGILKFTGEYGIPSPVRLRSWREVSPYLADVPQN
ncbi:MAG: hypothetical protein HZA54_07290 [Planctomycetes bacterium]|nr:hypothetical protein [Planctomycetota bacterium]